MAGCSQSTGICLIWRNRVCGTRDHNYSSCRSFFLVYQTTSLMGSHSLPSLYDPADRLQLLLTHVCINSCSPGQLAPALSRLRQSCTDNLLGHLTVSTCFIKRRCWKMGLWVPFLELNIQKTTVMMLINVPGHLPMIQHALKKWRWGYLTVPSGDSTL